MQLGGHRGRTLAKALTVTVDWFFRFKIRKQSIGRRWLRKNTIQDDRKGRAPLDLGRLLPTERTIAVGAVKDDKASQPAHHAVIEAWNWSGPSETYREGCRVSFTWRLLNGPISSSSINGANQHV